MIATYNRTIECPCPNYFYPCRRNVPKGIGNILIAVQSMEPVDICPDEFEGA